MYEESVRGGEGRERTSERHPVREGWGERQRVATSTEEL